MGIKILSECFADALRLHNGGDVSCLLVTVPKCFVKGGDTKFCRYPHEPEHQWQWILAASRHDWDPSEHATTILSKNRLHTAAIVSIQLLQG